MSGVGPAPWPTRILRRAAPASVIGVDPLDAFIARAAATLTDDRASFRIGSAVETGLPDGAVDVVVAGFVLNFVPDVAAALAEWRRVAGANRRSVGWLRTQPKTEACR
jgi:ubiquinone/menaquinone biosynthesis C-methylase UbiE